LFVPERTSVDPPTTNFFYAYNIRMFVDKNINVEKSKLLSRNWVITNGRNEVEEIQGPGVIGIFPEMYPGADFQYASCCPMDTNTGNMRGSFKMATKNGKEFDIIVPQYFFKAAVPISLS